MLLPRLGGPARAPASEVGAIEDAVARGLAYTLDVGADTYVLLQHDRAPCTACPPRMYERVQAHARDPRDYVVWHSDPRGQLSPWGVGVPTVNLRRWRLSRRETGPGGPVSRGREPEPEAQGSPRAG